MIKMDELPKEMQIEIDDNDVEKTYIDIIKSMNYIRNETIKNNKITNIDKEEYLHLTQRLASCLEEFIDEKTIDKMQKLVEQIDKKEELINYDFNQNKFWKKVNPNFVNTIDSIFNDMFKSDESQIQKQKTNINIPTIDCEKEEIQYNVFQAIKYIGACDEEKNIKNSIYNTILPHQEPIKITEKTSKEIKDFFANKKYKIVQKDNLVGKINKSFNEIEKNNDLNTIMNDAKEMGYSYLDLSIPKEEFLKFVDSNNELDIIALDKEEYIFSENSKKLKDFVKKTRYLSMPIIEAISKNLRDRFNCYIGTDLDKYLNDDVKKNNALLISTSMETIFYFGCAVGTGVVGSPHMTDGLLSVPIIAASLLTTGCVSLISNMCGLGSPTLKVLLSPLELAINAFGKNKTEVEEEKQRQIDYRDNVDVRINLNKILLSGMEIDLDINNTKKEFYIKYDNIGGIINLIGANIKEPTLIEKTSQEIDLYVPLKKSTENRMLGRLEIKKNDNFVDNNNLNTELLYTPYIDGCFDDHTDRQYVRINRGPRDTNRGFEMKQYTKLEKNNTQRLEKDHIGTNLGKQATYLSGGTYGSIKMELNGDLYKIKFKPNYNNL
jgi:hypothetical protein